MQEANYSSQDFKMLIDNGRRNQGMVVQDKGGLHTDLILSELQFVGSFLIYDSSNSVCPKHIHTLWWLVKLSCPGLAKPGDLKAAQPTMRNTDIHRVWVN